MDPAELPLLKYARIQFGIGRAHSPLPILQVVRPSSSTRLSVSIHSISGYTLDGLTPFLQPWLQATNSDGASVHVIENQAYGPSEIYTFREGLTNVRLDYVYYESSHPRPIFVPVREIVIDGDMVCRGNRHKTLSSRFHDITELKCLVSDPEELEWLGEREHHHPGEVTLTMPFRSLRRWRVEKTKGGEDAEIIKMIAWVVARRSEDANLHQLEELNVGGCDAPAECRRELRDVMPHVCFIP